MLCLERERIVAPRADQRDIAQHGPVGHPVDAGRVNDGRIYGNRVAP